MSACINVIASAHLRQPGSLNEYQVHPVGDFELWNDLKNARKKIAMAIVNGWRIKIEGGTYTLRGNVIENIK